MRYNIAQIITMRCDGACPYCMYGTKLNKINDVPLEDLLTFYDKLDGELELKVTGGEPLQPNNIARTIMFVKHVFKTHKMAYCQINTNGYWGVPTELAGLDITYQVSCDGPREYQDACFGRPIFDRLCGTLKQLSRQPNKHHIMMVVTEETLRHVPFMQQLAQQYHMGCKMQWVSPVDKASGQTMDPRFQAVDRLNKLYGTCREITFTCGHGRLPNDYLRFGIDAEGTIINCPIMSQYKTDLNIYKCDPADQMKIRKSIDAAMQGRSCQFPNGFKEYLQNCTPQQYKQVKKYVQARPDVAADLQEFFGVRI